MRAMRLEFSLAVVVILSLTLLIAGLIGLDMAVRKGMVVPPTLDVQYTLIRIAAYRTDYPDCPPTTLCPPQSVASPQGYYVAWSIYEPPTAAQPYSRTAHRLLVVPLQR